MNTPLRPAILPDFLNECSKIDPKIQVFGDGTYQHCPSGSRAYQIPVDDQYGHPFDFVAWFPSDPLEWWTRRGLATIIGEPALLNAEWRGRAINLYPTPAAWLHSRDHAGICILDWTANLRLAIGPVPGVRCQSRALADELAQRLQEQVKPRFAITVRGERHAE